MKTIAVIFLSYVGALCAFAASGFLASWAYQLNGCIWTSSGVFGVSFLAIVTGFAGVITNLFDFSDWFR
jgi:hypothetical protein